MGLFSPTKRPGQIVADSEFRSMEIRASLVPSRAAKFMQNIGIIVLVLSAIAFVQSPIPGLVSAISGGFIIAAGHFQQTVYDIRTLMLRNRSDAEDRRISDA